jgi:C2 domain
VSVEECLPPPQLALVYPLTLTLTLTLLLLLPCYTIVCYYGYGYDPNGYDSDCVLPDGDEDPVVKHEREAREKKESMEEKRPFKFRVNDIALMFEGERDDVFLEFIIGGVSVEEKFTETHVERLEDGESRQISEVRHRTRIYAAPTARFYTRMKERIDGKKKVWFRQQTFAGTWKGSYNELAVHELRVNVWQSKGMDPNVLIGTATETLQDIADGKMSRELRVRNTESARLERVCTVWAKVEFQEFFDFKLQFLDWQIAYAGDNQSERSDEYLRLGHDRGLNFAIDDAVDPLLFRMLCFCFPSMRQQPQGRLAVSKTNATDKKMFIHYRGTRLELENHSLTVSMVREFRTKLCGMRCRFYPSKTLGKQLVPLQGTLDHGFMNVDIFDEVMMAYNSEGVCGFCFSCLAGIPGCCCCNFAYDLSPEELAQRATDLVNNKEEDQEARLAHLREQHQDQFRFRVKGEVRPGMRPQFEQKGHAGIFGRSGGIFGVGRDDTIMVVRVVRAKGLASLDDFKETLNPTCVVEWNGWRKQTERVQDDLDPFWNEFLYFQVNTSGRNDSGDVPSKLLDFGLENAQSVLTVSVWDVGEDMITKSPLGHCSIDFATIYKNRKRRPVTDEDGNPVDRFVYRPTLPLLSPSHRVVPQDHMQLSEEEEKTKLALSRQTIEFEVYFMHGDNDVKAPVRDAKADVSSALPDPMNAAQQMRAQEYWNETLKNVKNGRDRFFAFMGKDEFTGDVHFLPTFLTRDMHPPMEIKDFYSLSYFTNCIEHLRKPVEEEDEYALDPEAADLRRMFKNVWVWSDPYFFLEKGRGDARDHSILLCSYLLARGLDAYVCIGSVRVRKNEPPREHVWVMTIHLPTKASSSASESADAEHDAPDTGATAAANSSGAQNWSNNGDGCIRFWETTNGRVTVLGNARLRLNLGDDWQPPRARALIDRARTHGRRGDVKVDSVTRSGSDLDDDNGDNMDGNGDDFAPMLDSDSKVSVGDGELSLPGIDDAFMNVRPSAQAGSLFRAARQSRVSTSQNIQTHQAALLDRTKHKALTATVEKQKSEQPYATLDIVFNDKELYANLQDADPSKAVFDFRPFGVSDYDPSACYDDTALTTNRWAKFTKKNWSEFFTSSTGKLRPFYGDKTLSALPADERHIEHLELAICERIKATIRSFRENELGFDTEFHEDFHFVGEDRARSASSVFNLRLTLEEEFGAGDASAFEDIEEHGDEEDVHTRARQKYIAGCTSLKQKRHDWRYQILGIIDKDKGKYKEHLMLFKTKDGNLIAKSVRDTLKNRDFITKRPKESPKFGIGAKVQALPAKICPVRVFVCVTWTKDEEENN